MQSRHSLSFIQKKCRKQDLELILREFLESCVNRIPAYLKLRPLLHEFNDFRPSPHFSSVHPIVEVKEHGDQPLFQGVLGDELDRFFAHPLDLLVETLDRVVGVDLQPKRLWEIVERQEIRQGIGPFRDRFVFRAPFSLESGERLLRLFFVGALALVKRKWTALCPFS